MVIWPIQLCKIQYTSLINYCWHMQEADKTALTVLNRRLHFEETKSLLIHFNKRIVLFRVHLTYSSSICQRFFFFPDQNMPLSIGRCQVPKASIEFLWSDQKVSDINLSFASFRLFYPDQCNYDLGTSAVKVIFLSSCFYLVSLKGWSKTKNKIYTSSL